MKKIIVYGITAILAYECISVVCEIAGNAVIALANGMTRRRSKKAKKAQVIGRTEDGGIVMCYVD